MFPFISPVNIRKTKVEKMFSGGIKKGALA